MEVGNTSEDLFIRRCYRKDVRSLSISYVEQPERLSSLEKFIKTELISELHIIQVTRKCLEYILSIFIQHSYNLVALEINTVSLSWDEDTIVQITKLFEIHKLTLKHLTIKCYLKSKYIAKILNHVPIDIESLDLSENIFDTESYYLEPLIKLISESELNELKLYNTSMSKSSICNLFLRLYEINKPIALRNIHGIEIVNSNIINSTKEQNAINKLKFINNSDYLNYLREVYFMKLMVNNRIRVWWPPTTTQSKTLYSGRYWPAKVIKANTIDKIFIVKYDNDELDHVQHNCIQPLSPFKYGGGLDDNIITNTFFIKDIDISNTYNKSRCILDFIESEWGIPESFAGNLITSGEVCEFRDPRDVNSTDPSDFVAYTKNVNSEEPIYSCNCIYQDDEHTTVSSCNIRRAVVVKWDMWVSECVRIHRLQSRNRLILGDLLNILRSIWLYPKNINPDIKIPSHPCNMRTDTLERHRRLIKDDLKDHPGLKRLDDIGSIDHWDRIELIKKCKTFHNELLNTKAKLNNFNFLENECNELRVQVDKCETRIQELEAQLLCFICTKSKINCIIHPCGHFQICDLCASSMGKCPSCTNRITSIQLIKFALC